MWAFTARIDSTGHISWQYSDNSRRDMREGANITFRLPTTKHRPRQEETLAKISETLMKKTVQWITPGLRKWILDLDGLRGQFPDIPSWPWFTGKVSVDPEFDYDQQISDFDPDFPDLELEYKPRLTLAIMKESFKRSTMLIQPPIEISESLALFQEDFPDSNKVAFIMIKYAGTKPHATIVDAVRDALKPYGITGVLAKDKQYHDNLTENVLTYLHGCGLGIAVFERISDDEFNPNVSLEVGYMLALRKPICYLKDHTLDSLQSDIIGKLYKPFDTYDPVSTIASQIAQWLLDKKIVS